MARITMTATGIVAMAATIMAAVLAAETGAPATVAAMTPLVIGERTTGSAGFCPGRFM
jgi:hypothetical protein